MSHSGILLHWNKTNSLMIWTFVMWKILFLQSKKRISNQKRGESNYIRLEGIFRSYGLYFWICVNEMLEQFYTVLLSVCDERKKSNINYHVMNHNRSQFVVVYILILSNLWKSRSKRQNYLLFSEWKKESNHLGPEHSFLYCMVTTLCLSILISVLLRKTGYWL